MTEYRAHPVNRAVAMDSAFLQASLFTSIVAFGVAGMAFVLGIVLTLVGFALRAPEPSTTTAGCQRLPCRLRAHRP